MTNEEKDDRIAELAAREKKLRDALANAAIAIVCENSTEAYHRIFIALEAVYGFEGRERLMQEALANAPEATQ
jgi:hypothetical protein